MRRRFVIYAQVERGSTYGPEATYVNTLMGVAHKITELHRAGARSIRWEACTFEEPTAEEHDSLARMLALSGVDMPRS